MRPGAQFTHEEMANRLRSQGQLGEDIRRIAGTGDLVPWASPMRGSVSDPPCFANLKGHYVRFNDLVYVTFAVSFGSAGVGSGTYSIDLPFDPWSSSAGPRGRWRAVQAGQEADGNVMVTFAGATMTYRTATPGTPTSMGPAAPFAWASGASIEGWLMYLVSKSA